MSLTLNNESQNSLSITNESKTGQDQAWADRGPVDFAPGENSGNDWVSSATAFTRESKNNITMNNESKN